MASTLTVQNAAQLAFWNNRPSATLYMTGTQSTTSTTNTQISWTSASGDTWGGWSSGSPTRYTVQVAGWYRLSGTVMWAGNATGARHSEFYQNGVENTSTLTIWGTAPGAGQFPHAANHVILQAAVGDYFQMNVWQSSGGALGIVGVCSMTIDLVHF